MKRCHTWRALTGLCAVSLLSAAGLAAGQEGDRFTFYGFGQPRGPVTPSELRMHHPLRLLELCRKVKAGALDRRQLEPLVGGRGILDALLAMDLDGLYLKLTGPAPAGAAALPALALAPDPQQWRDGPPAGARPAAPLDFGDLATGTRTPGRSA